MAKGGKSWGFIFFLVISLLLSLSITYFADDRFAASSEARGLLKDAFSILAGTVFAVIAIVGDPSMLLRGNWRKASIHAKEIQKQIQKYNVLFILYIICIIGLFSCEMIIADKPKELTWHIWVFRTTLVLSIFTLFVSFVLPLDIAAIQRDRLHSEISQRGAPK